MYPKQEHKGGNSQRATVSLREVVDIHSDSATGGQPNPVYDNEVATGVMAEVLQVAGGEIVRNIQVEGSVTFVVSMRVQDETITEHMRITVGSGRYSGRQLYVHRVHDVTDRSRPVFLQIHCKEKR